jgi:biotin transporter BioY
MKPRNLAILLMAGGVVFLVLGIWWLNVPAIERAAYVWLTGGGAFLIGGLIKYRALRR